MPHPILPQTRYVPPAERRALQTVVSLLALIPTLTGAAGMGLGPDFLRLDPPWPADLDSHFRFTVGRVPRGGRRLLLMRLGYRGAGCAIPPPLGYCRGGRRRAPLVAGGGWTS